MGGEEWISIACLEEGPWVEEVGWVPWMRRAKMVIIHGRLGSGCAPSEAPPRMVILASRVVFLREEEEEIAVRAG